jgi:23S rRNA (uracil1939-C5)-methyltransferase
VAHINGKALFIEGALPGEQVLFTYIKQRKRYDEAKVEKIIKPSPDRVEPRCAHFNICGGCSLQHLSPAAQIAAKQQVLLDSLKHIGGIEPKTVLAPLTGPSWGYRRRARLGVKFVIKKDKLLIGFREKRSSLLADIERCEVLHPPVGGLLQALRELIAGLEAYNCIPQIEVAAGDEATALVFRNLAELSNTDLVKLQDFGKQQNMQIYLQPAGPESVTLIWPETAALSYRLPVTYRDVLMSREAGRRERQFNLELFFAPTDFVQINADVNRAMISRVIELLQPGAHERVLDLFCGLGNFTLPLARHAAQVIGVEGDARLVERAKGNAQHNGIHNAEFYAADLSQDLSGQPWAKQHFDKILLDPPRTGALEIIQQLPAFDAARIVYISCNPATLARDARALTENGYTLISASVLDMFPHTTHVESIALFEKCQK